MDKEKVDPELQHFLEVEQQKAELQSKVCCLFVYVRWLGS